MGICHDGWGLSSAIFDLVPFGCVGGQIFPQKLIILSDALIAAATLLLAVLFPQIPGGTPVLLSCVVISVIRSVGTGIQTPAVNAAIPWLVPEDKLMKFNGINSTVQSLVQFAAPAAAGALLSWGTLRAALMIDIATAVVGIGILSAVAIPFEKREHTPSMWTEMKIGIQYAVKEAFIGRLLLVFGLFHGSHFAALTAIVEKYQHRCPGRPEQAETVRGSYFCLRQAYRFPVCGRTERL